MKKTLIVTLLATAIPTTYAEEAPTIIKTAKEAAKELKIPCQKLKVAKTNCVIAHFKSQDIDDPVGAGADPVKKPSDFYRILLGKTDRQRYLISDYYNNGQMMSPPFSTLDAEGLTNRWTEAELQATTSRNHIIYNKDGSKNVQFTVIVGSYEGPSVKWHSNGQMSVQREYKNDELTGAYKTWAEDGTLTEEGQYENGEQTGLWTTYDEYNGGQKERAVGYKNGIMTGSYTEWHSNGEVAAKGQYDDSGERTGLLTTWHDNGKKHVERTYKAGVNVGSYTEWHDNGETAVKGQYNDEGNRDGTWKAWHDNGKKYWVGEYKNDTEIGKWKYWDESGKLISEDDYKDGESTESAQSAEAIEEQIEERVSNAIDYNTERLTETSDAEQAAESLGTTCQVYKRKDQCVIAYFGSDSPAAVNRKNAKYYRVLHGKVGYLYIIQDYHTNGNPQSNTIFARSEYGVLESFDNSDLNTHGILKTYTPQGKKKGEFRYDNGEFDEYYDAPADVTKAAADATKAAVDVVKAAGAAPF